MSQDGKNRVAVKKVFFVLYHFRPVVLERIADCVKLNAAYQNCFQRTKGKFDTFCKRLEKIRDMMNTIEAFSGR